MKALIIIISFTILVILCLILLVAKDYYKDQLKRANQQIALLRIEKQNINNINTDLVDEIALYKKTIEKYKQQIDNLEENYRFNTRRNKQNLW